MLHSKRVQFQAFCLAVFLLVGTQSMINKDNCRTEIRDRLDYMCIYPGRETPCYRERDDVQNALNVTAIVDYCCEDVVSCVRNLLTYRNYCCTTFDCLRKCYNLDRHIARNGCSK
ncbi:hypothetical protein M3Y98_00177800 [Aphelenchoides besseyi]|nr:hypothetical protein M3Y98_00177800 [Aphelenchoides besseyi]KAI6200074.1 hypothetical protein M3Y96_00694700 [Aphelenchoides besseyi]